MLGLDEPRMRYQLLAGGGLALLLLTVPPLIFESNDFMPHGHCYLWRGDLLALHVASDIAIGVSYVAISLTLAFLVYRARSAIPFHWVLLAFGTFIIACGATHLMEVWLVWNPAYWLAGNVKLLTAIASVATAVVLPPLVPRALALVDAQERVERQRLELNEREILLADAEKARLEAEAARAEADTANRAKDAFLAMVSHELRAPLSPISLWSRMLLEGQLDREQRKTALETIERSARVQARLIDDLLDISRIVSGKLRLDVRPVEPAAVIEAALEAVRPSAATRQIRLQAALPGEPETIVADPQRLQQILWNLLSNAVAHTPNGGDVEVRLQRLDADIEIIVSDSGEGIPANMLPHLFEPFRQVDRRPQREERGLGLGLAIVKRLTELHGGTVSVHSDGPGKGAEFRVRLPVTAPTADAADQSQSRATPQREPARIAGVRILVVEDEADVNEAVCALLRLRGAEVRTAFSGREALQILDSWIPDVLVSDIEMPEQNGYELMRAVRSRGADAGGRVPAMALTAYGRVDDRMRALAAGFQKHIAKPADPEELTAAIAGLVARTR